VLGASFIDPIHDDFNLLVRLINVLQQVVTFQRRTIRTIFWSYWTIGTWAGSSLSDACCVVGLLLKGLESLVNDTYLRTFLLFLPDATRQEFPVNPC
jgi:hypothetical protein